MCALRTATSLWTIYTSHLLVLLSIQWLIALVQQIVASIERLIYYSWLLTTLERRVSNRRSHLERICLKQLQTLRGTLWSRIPCCICTRCSHKICCCHDFIELFDSEEMSNALEGRCCTFFVQGVFRFNGDKYRCCRAHVALITSNELLSFIQVCFLLFLPIR